MLEPMKISNETRKKLSSYLNPNLIKEKPTGQKTKNPKTGTWEDQTLSYISANTCIDLLNDIFGHNWSMKIIDRWTEPGYNHIIKKRQNFRTKALEWPNNVNPPEELIQIDGTGAEYVEIPQLPTAWCIVELTVPLKDEEGTIHYVTKSAFGSQAINGNQSVQSINGFKGAQSDALKKAATLLGIALELYRDDNESEVFDEIYDSMTPIIWTDETIEQNKLLWNSFEETKNKYEWTNEDVAYFVEQVTNGYTEDIYKMPVKYMKTLLANIEEYMEGDDE